MRLQLVLIFVDGAENERCLEVRQRGARVGGTASESLYASWFFSLS